MGLRSAGWRWARRKSEREDICEFTAALLPRDKPRYLMGVGTPLDILEAVHRGVDMFDCIIPTQLAQRGGVFTSRGILQLRRGVYKFSEEKPRPGVRLPDLRALLARLSASSHQDGRNARLAVARARITSISTTISCGRCARASSRGPFLEFYQAKRAILDEPDPEHPATPRKPKRRSGPRGSARTQCMWRTRALAASCTSARARSCTRARRRWRKRALYVSRAAPARARCARRRRSAARGVGCRARRGGECDGGDPLLRRAGRDGAGAADADHQLRERPRFAAARFSADAISLPICAIRRPTLCWRRAAGSRGRCPA